MTPRENPFRHMGEWYFFDDEENVHGPYRTQYAALRALLVYMDPRTTWQKIGDALVRGLALAVGYKA